MKTRVPAIAAAIGILVGAIIYRQTHQTPQPKIAISEAATLHKHLTAYALDNGGAFPSDLNALFTKSYGAGDQTRAFLPNIIEYRGAGLTTATDPNTLLLRFGIEGRPDMEGRLYAGGSAKAMAAKLFASHDGK